MAGRTWLKPHYVATDYDPVTKELLPGSMAPGMYVEDEQTFDQILADPKVGRIERAFNAPPIEAVPGHGRP